MERRRSGTNQLIEGTDFRIDPYYTKKTSVVVKKYLKFA